MVKKCQLIITTMKDNIFIVVIVSFISLYSCSSNQDNHKSNPKVINVVAYIGRGRVVNLSETAALSIYWRLRVVLML